MVSFQSLDPVNTSVNNAPARLQALASLVNNKLDNETLRRNAMLQVLQQGLQSGGPVLQDYLTRKAGRAAGKQYLVADGFDSGLQITGNGEQPNQPTMPNTATTNTAPQMTSELLTGATAPATTQSQSTAFPVPTATSVHRLQGGLTGEVQRSPRVIQLEQMIKNNQFNPAQAKEFLDNNTGLTNEGQFNRAKIRHEDASTRYQDASTFNTTYQGANEQNNYNNAIGKIGSNQSRSGLLADAKIASENRSNRPSGGGAGFSNDLTKTEMNNQQKMLTASVKARNLIAPMRAAIANLKTKFPDGSFDKNKMAALMAGKYLPGASENEKALATLAGTYNELSQQTAKANQPGTLTDRDIKINKEIAGDLGWETWGSLENKLNQVEANMKSAQNLHAGILKGTVDIYDTNSALPGAENVTGNPAAYQSTTQTTPTKAKGKTVMEYLRGN